MKVRFSLNPLDLILIEILLFTLFAACSCSPLKKQERQQKKAESFYYDNPEKLAAKAEQLFPNIIEGTTKGTVDTVRDIQTVRIESGAPEKVRIIQTHSTDTIRMESGVKVAQLKAEYDAVKRANGELIKIAEDEQKKLFELSEDRNKYRLRSITFALLLVVICGAVVYLKIKKIF